MNKKIFLNALQKHLAPLSKDERDEIISFYEDRFVNAIYEGKTEEDVINELERPEDIARNVLAEYNINQEVSPKSHRINLLQVFGLLWFDILVSSWLVTVAVVVPLALAGSWFSYFTIFTVFKYYSFLQGILMFVGGTAGYLLYLFVIILLLELGYKIVSMIIVWHIDVFTGDRFISLKNSLRNFSLISLVKKLNIPNKAISLTLLGSVLTVIVVMIISFYAFDDLGNIDNSGVTIYDITEDIYTYEAVNGGEIAANFADMDIVFETGNVDEIVITHTHNYDNGFTIDYSSVSNRININDNRVSRDFWDFYANIFRLVTLDYNNKYYYHVQELKIVVPESLELKAIYLDTVSDSISVTNFKGQDVHLNTVSSEILLTNSHSNRANIDSVSGDIIINNSVINDIEIDNVSGSVYIDDTTSKDNSNLVIDNVSGSVELTNVYIKRVHIETVSGNINYYNDDNSYILDYLDLDSVSGNINHSIPNNRG